MKLPNWLMYALVIVVTLVWVTSFVVGLISKSYQPPEQINLLFSSLIGGLLLQAAAKREGKDDDDDKSSKGE